MKLFPETIYPIGFIIEFTFTPVDFALRYKKNSQL